MIDIEPYVISVPQIREELGDPTDIPTEIGRVYDDALESIRQRNIDLLKLKSRFYETAPISGAPASDERGIFSNFVMSRDEVRAHLAEMNTTFVTDAMITRIINRLVHENLIDKVKIPRSVEDNSYDQEDTTDTKLDPLLPVALPYTLPLKFSIVDHVQLRNEIGDPNTKSISDTELGRIINRNVQAFNIRSRFYQEDPMPGGTVPDERGIFVPYVMSKEELRMNLAELNAEFVTDGMLQKIINRKVASNLTGNLKVPRRVSGSPYSRDTTIAPQLERNDLSTPYNMPMQFTIIDHIQLRNEIGDPNYNSISDKELGEIIKRNVDAFKIRSRFYQENPAPSGPVSDMRGMFSEYVMSKEELRVNLAELNSDFVTDGMLQKIINRKVTSHLSNHVKIPRYLSDPTNTTQEVVGLDDNESPDSLTGDVTVPPGFSIMSTSQLRGEIGDPNIRSITNAELANIIRRNIGLFKPYQILEEEYKNMILGKEIAVGFEGVEEIELTGETVNDDMVRFEIPEGYYPLPIKMTALDGKAFSISTNLERDRTISPYPRRRYDVRGNKIWSIHRDTNVAKFWLIDRDHLQDYVLSKSNKIAGLSERINNNILREAREALESQLKYEEIFTEAVTRVNAEIIAEARVMADNKLQERDKILGLLEATNSKIIAEAKEMMGGQLQYEQIFNDTVTRINAEIVAEARTFAENKLQERDRIIGLVEATNAKIIAEAKDMLSSQLQYEEVFNNAVSKTNNDIIQQVRSLAENKLVQQEKLIAMVEATNAKIIVEAAAMHQRLVAEGARLRTSEEIIR